MKRISHVMQPLAVMGVAVEVAEVHLERALTARRLVAVRTGDQLAGVLVNVPDVRAQRVLAREGLQAGQTAQV